MNGREQDGECPSTRVFVWGKTVQNAHPSTGSAIDECFHQEWLDQAVAIARRIRDLRKLYALIEEARLRGDTFRLGDLSQKKLPLRGVYIFLDPSERNFIDDGPRIVRVGTHAVSSGSKSTLKARLRNHLGTLEGSGSNRGSIFRLHVGRAMLVSDGQEHQLPSWGMGQDAPQHTRDTEQLHELRVSSYLKSLEVFVIPIDDPPSKDSMRAAVESQLIALCSENLEPIDKPSLSWLGHSSPMESIVYSGLWNLRDVGRQYMSEGKGSVSTVAKILEKAM